jgi:hypothetical protein
MMKPWREVAVPNEEVRQGTFQQAEFAADLSRAHEGGHGPCLPHVTVCWPA